MHMAFCNAFVTGTRWHELRIQVGTTWYKLQPGTSCNLVQVATLVQVAICAGTLTDVQSWA